MYSVMICCTIQGQIVVVFVVIIIIIIEYLLFAQTAIKLFEILQEQRIVAMAGDFNNFVCLLKYGRPSSSYHNH